MIWVASAKRDPRVVMLGIGVDILRTKRIKKLYDDFLDIQLDLIHLVTTMAWMLQGLEKEYGKNDSYFCEEYLNSPILITPRTQYVIAVDRLHKLHFKDGVVAPLPPRTLRTLSRSEKQAYNLLIPDLGSSESELLDPDEYPSMLSALFATQTSHFYEESEDIAGSIYKDCLSSLRKWIDPEGSDKNSLPSFSLSLTPDERYYYERWAFWDLVVSQSREMYRKKRLFRSRLNFPCGYVITNCEMARINIVDSSGKRHEKVMTWHQVLMIKDSLYSRAQSFTAARVIYPSNARLPERLKDLISWHEECLLKYSNSGFEILKSSESLSKAFLSTISGDEFEEDGPFYRMLRKVYKKEYDLSPIDYTSSLAVKFSAILWRAASIEEVVELFGLHRISCHPLIDPVKGGISAAEQAREPDFTTEMDSNEIDWNFKRIFLESHIRINKCWPKLQFPDGCKTKLYNLYRKQVLGITRHSYPLDDWSQCRYTQIFDLDMAPNFLEFMDDKSISQYRSNIASNWDPKIERKSHRRLLLEMLSREEIDLKAVFYAVMRREIPFDWLIVCLYPKERELKPAPRMFSMMVFEMRAFFTILEANIADNVFKYMPQQTMTKDRLTIAKLFMDLTKPSADSGEIHMFLEVDLSRWNLRWRELTVHQVGSTLDDMFGSLGCFTYVHEFFKECMIVVRIPDLLFKSIHDEHSPESEFL